MAEREELGGGSWRIRTAKGTATWTPRAPKVIEVKYTGYADVELVRPLMDEMVRLMERVGPVYSFSDVLELEGYDPDLWKEAQAWLVAHRSTLAGTFVLQGSSTIEMGIRLLNLFSQNIVVAYTKRSDYEKKLRECRERGL